MDMFISSGDHLIIPIWVFFWAGGAAGSSLRRVGILSYGWSLRASLGFSHQGGVS
jgi:hypothetical protein